MVTVYPEEEQYLSIRYQLVLYDADTANALTYTKICSRDNNSSSNSQSCMHSTMPE